uniref:Uncharacterized protein n=1 Tax=Anguilla anguilla TaxID=7936 RepID=A0A0E9RES9_ANGAN
MTRYARTCDIRKNFSVSWLDLVCHFTVILTFYCCKIVIKIIIIIVFYFNHGYCVPLFVSHCECLLFEQ